MKTQYYVVLLLSFYSFAAHSQKLSKKETQILKLVDKSYDESIQFLEKVVNINSGTNNTLGV